jgi:hypothetical protein
MMQHDTDATKFVTWLLALALPALACSSSPRSMSYSQELSVDAEQDHIEFFTHDPRLYDAALRSVQRIESALGTSHLVLAEPTAAARCAPLQAGCGFELSFAQRVYCFGDPDPALACTSFGGGGKTLGVRLQSDLDGDELDNRLIHEFFHVITLDQAPHSVDGLFMAYSLGDERITRSTLECVCGHFPCQEFVVEQESSVRMLVQR